MFHPLIKSFLQLIDARVIKILFFSTFLSICVTLVLSLMLYFAVSFIPIVEIPWIGDFLSSSSIGDVIMASSFVVVLILFWLFFFPYILLGMTTLFQEQIIALVEDKHYPNLPLALNQKISDQFFGQLKFYGKILLVNLLLSPLYLILMFTGFGAVVLAALINGYFIGVEYYSMVSNRRLTKGQHEAEIRKRRVTIHFMGIALYLAMLVPFVNLLMPVLGCMFFTHLFYRHNRANSFMTSPQ